MKNTKTVILGVTGMLCAAMLLAGCKREEPAPKANPPGVTSPGELTDKEHAESTEPAPSGGEASTEPARPSEAPPASNPMENPHDMTPAASLTDHTLKLRGIEMTVPEGWVYEQPAPSAMAPIALFTLPTTEGDTIKTQVRITHFPTMHGMDPNMNINRWLGFVTKPDGSNPTQDDAEITSLESNGTKITIVEVAGKIAGGGMQGGGAPIDDGRMFAAIIDHPNGPHFVKVQGPAKTMEAAGESLYAFVKSAKVAQ